MNPNIFKPAAALICIALLPAFVSAQTAHDFFSNTSSPALFLGVDFTRAKLIDAATANTQDIVERQYDGINELLVTEVKKYDVGEAFHRGSLDHDLGAVTKRNEHADPDKILSTNTADYHRFTADSIKAILRGFDYGGKKGVGIIFVVEGMSKTDKGISLWATLVDMSTGKILLTDRVEGKTGMSFGFRNYWATGIKNAMEEIKKKKYKEWKANNGG
jgi:hypothetical protein